MRTIADGCYLEQRDISAIDRRIMIKFGNLVHLGPLDPVAIYKRRHFENQKKMRYLKNCVTDFNGISYADAYLPFLFIVSANDSNRHE